MEKTRRVNLAAANSFHGDKLIRLSANVLVQTWLRANTTSTFLYIYISMLSAPLMHLIVAISARLVSTDEWKLQIEGEGGERTRVVKKKEHRLSAQRNRLDNCFKRVKTEVEHISKRLKSDNHFTETVNNIFHLIFNSRNYQKQFT